MYPDEKDYGVAQECQSSEAEKKVETILTSLKGIERKLYPVLRDGLEKSVSEPRPAQSSNAPVAPKTQLPTLRISQYVLNTQRK